MRNPSAVIMGAAVLALLAGCKTTTYTVQVDAIAQPTKIASAKKAPPHSYYIRSKNPRLDEASLRYQEVSDYVKTALSGRGMYEAPSPEAAGVVIDIDYGMESPRMKYELISKTVQTADRHETRQVMQQTKVADGLYIEVPVEETRSVPGELRQVSEVEPVIVYEKYLKVSARENKEVAEGRAPAEVWSVNVSAEDKSQELRKYIPILASATADYIGTNTRESKPVTLDENNEAVKFIRKGM